nr:hypothetical protein [Tanacetum cinerariifolium]
DGCPDLKLIEIQTSFQLSPLVHLRGGVALLEIARLFSILYSNPNTRGRYNNILWVDIWRALQLQWNTEGENGLWLHVSKPPENAYVKQIFELMFKTSQDTLEVTKWADYA